MHHHSRSQTRPQYAISLRGISKSYGEKQVLQSVNLTVKPGEIIGILGANGAGKSTLINIMNGLITPNSGAVEVWGVNPSQHSVGKFVGYAPQDVSIYPHLSVEQNLQCIGEIQAMPHRLVIQERERIIELFGLESVRKQRASTLSGGQKRRLHTGMALIHQPRIAFLDEPTVAADVEARNQILHAVKQLAQSGTTVVYTSHYLSEFEALNARIAVLNNGSITVDESLQEIIAHYSSLTVRVHFDTADLPSIPGWKSHKNWLELEKATEHYNDVIAQLLSHPSIKPLAITNIEIIRPSLENAYLNIIHQEEK